MSLSSQYHFQAMMRQTSKEAYKCVNLPARRADVYEIIKRWQPVTNERIGQYLDWTINRITGRTKELVDGGLVKSAGKVKGHTLWVTTDRLL